MTGPKFYLRTYPVPDAMEAQAAAIEDDGWDGVFLLDSQNLAMDVVGALYTVARATSRLEIGTAVTNLTSRHPAVVASTFATLHHVSKGRAVLGVGRGDTALELIGVKPPSASQFEVQLRQVKAYGRGEPVDVGGFSSRITWLPLDGEPPVPVDVFASGPHVLEVAGRLADRVTVTVGAEPARVTWAVNAVRAARAAAGLDPDAVPVGAYVVVGVGTDRAALDALVRGNASISAHFQRHATSTMSPADAAIVGDVTEHYDEYHHGLEHAAQADALTDDFLDRFCVIGPPEACIERLRDLIELGLSHLVVVGGSRELDVAVRERSDHLVAHEVFPALRAETSG